MRLEAQTQPPPKRLKPKRDKAIADAASDIGDIFAQSLLVDIGFQPCGLRSQRPAAASAAAATASAGAAAAEHGSASDLSSINPHTGLKDEEIALYVCDAHKLWGARTDTKFLHEAMPQLTLQD